MSIEAELPTGRQLDYLRRLAAERGEVIVHPRTREEASAEITRLRALAPIARGSSTRIPLTGRQEVEFVAAGDLFESGCSALVNAVNCRGVMGAGIALEFKRRFPAMFADYRVRCRRGEVQLGRPFLWRAAGADGPSVVNFPTKDHWRDPSRLESLTIGLDCFCRLFPTWGIESLAVPALGCGHGGLDWEDVRPLLVDAFGRLGIAVRVYEPRADSR